MTAPEAKREYRIERDGNKFVGIDSDEETLGVYDTGGEAQADIARRKKEDAIWERTQELMRHAVRTIMAEFDVDMETAVNWVNTGAGMTVLGMEEGDEEPKS
jgi:phosphoribosylaminoimidazole (AIR) synthetase